MQLIGRENEIKELSRLELSNQPEFVVIYGRRRVGKTFLIRSFFKDKFCFYATGLAKGNRGAQLDNFHKSLTEYGYKADLPKPNDWFEAFDILKTIINRSRQKRKVVFMDEMPWMDTQKSEFKQALDKFWNSWGMMQSNLLLIVCGSAASWMVKNIINDRGGLHNRLTCKIHLSPFNLAETKAYLLSQGIRWPEDTIAQCYMVWGGIPYYLHLLDRSLSLAQNIDRMFFDENALLHDEFNNLYNSLFKKADDYIHIINTLAKKKSGLTRDEIATETALSNGGGLTRRLEELVQCGFVRKYQPLKERAHIYQLIDFFTIFYLHFVRGKHYYDNNAWMHLQGTPKLSTWLGLSFERLCFLHIPQIKNALGISGIATKAYAFLTQTAQIDMVIERADGAVNLCEMKYSSSTYSLTKSEAVKIQNRINELRSHFIRGAIIPVLVSNSSVQQNEKYNQMFFNNITLKNLFLS